MPVGRAEGHAVDWHAARRAADARRDAECERRDSQLDGPNGPGWAASEEQAATSVRRVDGEATLRALPLARVMVDGDGSSARSVASAAARFTGRGLFLTLRRCVGGAYK